jgi:tRNA(Glu) U13 pseudouridine synthase TruD
MDKTRLEFLEDRLNNERRNLRFIRRFQRALKPSSMNDSELFVQSISSIIFNFQDQNLQESFH